MNLGVLVYLTQLICGFMVFLRTEIRVANL